MRPGYALVFKLVDVAQPVRGGSSRVAERLGYIKSFGLTGISVGRGMGSIRAVK